MMCRNLPWLKIKKSRPQGHGHKKIVFINVHLCLKPKQQNLFEAGPIRFQQKAESLGPFKRICMYTYKNQKVLKVALIFLRKCHLSILIKDW